MKGLQPVSIIKLWFMASAAFLGLFFLYNFVPIVLFLLAVSAMLGLITFGVVSIARAFDRRRNR